MPELPEVKTTASELNRRIKGRQIIGVWLDWQKMKDINKTKGRKIKEVSQKGKNIFIHFKDGNTLLVHMKMTGHLLVGKWEIKNKKVIPISPKELKEKINGYVHFILELNNGQMLGFSDLRKFGKVVFGKREKIENLSELKKLGPEANATSFKQFSENIKKRKKTIYQVLMDQTVVSGIGNIYASEILFKAKVHPFKSANKLTEDELKKLHKATKYILDKALKARGTSTADYRDTFGKKGRYGDMRLIYQKEGESCPNKCGGKIIREKKGGRSAFFCNHCQKLET